MSGHDGEFQDLTRVLELLQSYAKGVCERDDLAYQLLELAQTMEDHLQLKRSEVYYLAAVFGSHKAQPLERLSYEELAASIAQLYFRRLGFA